MRQAGTENLNRSGDSMYRSLFENMLNGLAYCRMLYENGKPSDFIYLDVNSAFETQTGLKNVVGRKASEVIPGIRESDQLLLEIYGRVALSGKPERFEMFVESLQMWFSFSVYCPEPEHFVSLFDVITERRQTEESLRNEKAFLRSLIDSADVLIYYKDADGVYLACNKASEAFIGLSEREQIGKTDFDLFEHENAESFREHDQMLLANGAVLHTEEWVPRPDGRAVLMDTRKAPVYGPDGQAIGLVGVSRDITERKIMEEALRKSEERFRSIMENVPGVAVQGYGLDGTVLFWNLASEFLYGYSAVEALGANLLDLVIPPEMREGVTQAIRDMVESGEPIPAGELSLMRKDGSRVAVYSSHALIQPSGREPELFCLDVDLSRIKQLEKENIALLDQLHQVRNLQSLGVLVSGIAHNFNNLLTIIIGNCALMNLKPEAATDYMAPIEKAAERAAQLCRQMQTYAGTNPLSAVSRIAMGEMVDDVTGMLKSGAPRNVAITVDSAPGIPFIIGDEGQIRQIVTSLLHNATESIGEKPGTVAVTLSRKQVVKGRADRDHLGREIPSGWYVCLEICDTGCGMDEEMSRRIFEPFYTTKFTGRGLGLPETLGIIAAHKGALQLSSQPGLGTTFTVYLPADDTGPAPDETQMKPPPSAPWRGSGTVLLVEDEQQVRSIADFMLKELGFAVIAATNGREALEAFQKCAADIDLVVTDIGMPVMDGYELFRELKKIDPALPIIISSGFDTAEICLHIDCEDIAGILNKPYRFDQMEAVMKSVKASTGEVHLKAAFPP